MDEKKPAGLNEPLPDELTGPRAAEHGGHGDLVEGRGLTERERDEVVGAYSEPVDEDALEDQAEEAGAGGELNAAARRAAEVKAPSPRPPLRKRSAGVRPGARTREIPAPRPDKAGFAAGSSRAAEAVQGYVDRAAQLVREKAPEGLAGRVREHIRRRPLAHVAGMFALGFIAARLLRR